MKKTDDPIIIKETFVSTSQQVWSAITDPSEMRQWFFENMPDFQPKIGFKTQFEVKNEGRTFTHTWQVTEVIPQKKIKYNWFYPEYPGDAFVTFLLQKKDNATELTLVMDIVEDFPKNIPEFTRESCIAGWNYFINQQLKNYLTTK